MSSKFQKKSLAQLKKAEEAILDRDLDDFQGTKTELFFIKLGRKISRNRLAVFSGILVFFLFIGSILGYLEYADYRENKATEKLEVILESWQKGQVLPVQDRINQLEKFRSEDSFGSINIRLAKTLSDLYVEAGDYSHAAELLEEYGTQISEIREAKAYYFYLAGNYRDLAGEKDQSLKDYETAASLLENLREVASFRAWSLYHAGRLHYELGSPSKSREYLQRVLLIEPGEAGSDLTEVKKYSTFLLLKLSQAE